MRISRHGSDDTEFNLVISRCCFEEDGKEMYQEIHVYNALAQPLFSSLNLF